MFKLYFSVREQLKELTKQYEKSENDLKALQSVGQVGNGVWGVEGDGDLFFQLLAKSNAFFFFLSQIVGEVLKQLTEEKFIVKATNGPRYVVGCRRQLDKSKLKAGTRVALDMTTLS